jgi:quinol monooxygenase YgiN
MILVAIRTKVLAEKRKELSQTIASLIGSLRTEKGCRRGDFYRSMENENELCILEEGDTRENLNRHLNSERFRVLRGAMSLLQEPFEMEVWDGRDQERDEKICILKHRARKKQAYPGG